MLNIQIKPISQWPGTENKSPKSSTFKATYKQTLDQLKKELNAIRADASSLILEMRISQHQLTLDGSRLRAHVRPDKAGVILSFNRRNSKVVNGEHVTTVQTLSYPCDAFDDWQDNLRAITLSLESLRRVERYGVFKYDDIVDRLALPSAEGSVGTRESAAAFLEKHSGIAAKEIMFSEVALSAAFRKAAQTTHPDAGGEYHDRIPEFRHFIVVKTCGGSHTHADEQVCRIPLRGIGKAGQFRFLPRV